MIAWSLSAARRSLSAQRPTFAQDIGDPDALQEVVDRLSQRVAQQLRRKQLQGRTVKLKLRLSGLHDIHTASARCHTRYNLPQTCRSPPANCCAPNYTGAGVLGLLVLACPALSNPKRIPTSRANSDSRGFG